MDEMAGKKSTPRGGSSESVKSLLKVMSILDAFSTSRRSMSLTEIVAASGFPRSTAHRLAASMRDVGLLDQDGQRDRYRLGIRLYELGSRALANMSLHREARPFLDALSQVSGHAVNVSVFDGRQAIVIHRVSAPSGTQLTMIEAAPVHCTSTGKAILAFQPAAKVEEIIAAGLTRFTANTITDGRKLRSELKLIRARGYSIDESEHQPGIRCVGAPIRDRTGRAIAGISVNGAARLLKKEEVGQVAQMVIHHAGLIEAKL
jgi:DNA-binding IclR family transcriptional regulator